MDIFRIQKLRYLALLQYNYSNLVCSAINHCIALLSVESKNTCQILVQRLHQIAITKCQSIVYVAPMYQAQKGLLKRTLDDLHHPKHETRLTSTCVEALQVLIALTANGYSDDLGWGHASAQKVHLGTLRSMLRR